ncbi:MAG: permease-like cell division protein FtsX [Pygmaiobacter massiliensis]|nr:permease-like cell division protein FtsX [Pygmaiobacter massiliensis]
MSLSGIRYLSRQGLHNLVQNRLMTLASVGVLTACLVITGVAALLSANVSNFVDYLGAQNRVVVYVELDADDATAQAVGDEIGKLSNITEYGYTSKEEALEQTKGWISEYDNGAYASVLDGYEGENNPLYASYSVTVDDLNQIAKTTQELEAISGVDFVDSPSELASTLVGIKTTVNLAGWGLVAVLAVVAVVVIVNTIRLTVFARRKEINIMKFVGATNGFIRLPFWVEGTAIGAISAVLAFGIISAIYIWLLGQVSVSGISWLQSIYFQILPYRAVWKWLLGGFAAAGILLGGVGSSLSIRRYLKV